MPAALTLSPQINVYLNDGDKEEDFKVKGNFLAKKYEVIQKLQGRCRAAAGARGAAGRHQRASSTSQGIARQQHG